MHTTAPRAHHVETILTVIPQQRLGDASVLDFARALVQAAPLKVSQIPGIWQPQGTD